MADWISINILLKYFRSNGDKPLPLLPGMETLYTPQQQMWSIFAYNMCGKNMNRTQEVPDPEFRVNGIMRQIPNFAYEFNCAPRTPMNPSDYCDVWFWDGFLNEIIYLGKDCTFWWWPIKQFPDSNKSYLFRLLPTGPLNLGTVEVFWSDKIPTTYNIQEI